MGLRSEGVVIEKSVQGHFLLIVIMETLKYTCVPSFTSMHCSLRSEEVVIGKSAQGHFFVDGHHRNTEIHMHTKFHLHVLYCL